MRRIIDALLFDLGVRTYVHTYVYLSVTLGKDRHIHTVTLGKDCHIYIRSYAWAHGHWQCQWTENEIETEETYSMCNVRKKALTSETAGHIPHVLGIILCVSSLRK